MDLLKEAILTPHFKERIDDRVLNSTLSLPFQLPMIEGYSDKELLNLIKGEINNVVLDRIQKNTSNQIFEKYTCLILIDITLLYKDKPYKPIISGGNTSGNVYIIPINNNTLSSLIITESSDKTKVAIRCADHLRREKKLDIEALDIDVVYASDYKFTFNIDSFINKLLNPIKIQKVSEEEVNYEPRTDYRKDALFKSKEYGLGTIVNTSNGVKGTGDMNGKLDWIDVDFKKPYLKQGKLTSIRRIGPIYTKIVIFT